MGRKNLLSDGAGWDFEGHTGLEARLRSNLLPFSRAHWRSKLQ